MSHLFYKNIIVINFFLIYVFVFSGIFFDDNKTSAVPVTEETSNLENPLTRNICLFPPCYPKLKDDVNPAEYITIGTPTKPETNSNICHELGLNNLNRDGSMKSNKKIIKFYGTWQVYAQCQFSPSVLPHLEVVHIFLNTTWRNLDHPSAKDERSMIHTFLSFKQNHDHLHDVHIIDTLGKTIFMHAAHQNFQKAIRILLLLNSHDKFIYDKDHSKFERNALMYAAESGNLKIIKMILSHVNQYTKSNHNGYSIALDAIHSSHSIDLTDKFGQNALMIAVYYNHSHVANYLIDAGTRLDTIDHSNQTICDIALLSDQLVVVERLIKVMNAEMTKLYMKSILQLAATHGSKQIVETLMDRKILKGVDEIPACRLLISTLTTAAKFGHKQFAEYLLSPKIRVPINSIDENDLTPLMTASLYGHLSCVKLFSNRRASINQRSLFYKDTALMLAASKGYLNIVSFLVHRGANIFSKDRYGCNALTYANRRKQFAVVNFLMSKGAYDDVFDHKIPRPSSQLLS